jgi:hypothetical protein
MTLSKRQETAAAICAELHKLGVAIINPMPLSDDQHLRYHVIDSQRDAILEKLCGWGWHPQYLQPLPRVCPQPYGLVPASIYEIRIEHERQPIPDRKIYGEVAERKKTEAEIQGVKKYLGIG